MIWIVALICLGLSGLAGFYQGPIRAGSSLLGLVVGTFLASPLARIIKPVLSVFGLKDLIWSQVLPLVIAFAAVVIVIRIIGSMVNQKVVLAHKYDEDDSRYYRWERACQRLGLVLGLFCGAFYFFLIMLPIYVGGYFTAQLDTGDNAPTSVRFVNSLRSDIQSLKIDSVLAAYDPTPAQAYKAGDLAALVLKNRLLESRLSHYPAFLTLGDRAEFQALANDLEFQKLFTTQGSARQLLNYPKIQAILTNNALLNEVIHLTSDNLDDLYDYLGTGKSAKYDSEKILGTWVINLNATVMLERKKVPTSLTAQQLAELRMRIISQVSGLSLVATPDNQTVLRKETAGEPAAVLARGSWKTSGDSYQLTFPNAKPETAEAVAADDQLKFIRNGVTIVFDRDL